MRPSNRIEKKFVIYPNDSVQSETGQTAEFGVKQGFKLGKWNLPNGIQRRKGAEASTFYQKINTHLVL